MIPSPFNSQYISSPYGPRDIGFHSGTDWGAKAGAYPGAPIYASGPGLVMFSGWNGPRPGNVKTVLYDGFSLARRVMYCHLQNLNGARVNQRVNTGDIIGYVGDTGSALGHHLHAELVGGGDPMKLVFDPNSYVGGGSGAGGEEPEKPPLILKGDTMIRIQSPNRGLALIGPGFYRHLANAEEVQQSEFIIEKHLNGNDRQFDLWVSMASTGVVPASTAKVTITDAQVKAIADAVAAQIGQSDVTIVYEKVADSVRDRFREDPLK